MDIHPDQMPKIHKSYYNVLKTIVQMGSYYSAMKPWPNPTIAFMCIKGWIKRSDHSENILVITGSGRLMHDHAMVTL